jgi:hypothetical protein
MVAEVALRQFSISFAAVMFVSQHFSVSLAE